MQSDDGSSACPIKTAQTEPEVVPTNPTQICFVPVKTGNSYNNYKHIQSKICGAFQIILGILSIVFNVYEISQTIGPGMVGHGIWCGIVFIIAGSFGVAAGISRTKCPCVAFMVLCIVSASLTAVLFSFGMLSIFFLMANYRMPLFQSMASFSMQSGLVILALIEAGVAIWGSAICCKVVCCGATRPVAGVLYRSSDPSERILIFPQGQCAGQIQILPTSVPGYNE